MPATDLIVPEIFDAIPALQGHGDEAFLAKVSSLFEMMSSAPEGMDEGGSRWAPPNLKIKMPTTRGAMVPGNAVDGDIWSTGGEIVWDSKAGVPFEFVALYRWISHARFQPNNFQPDCRSNDGEHNVFGTLKCSDCPDEPFKNGRKTLCQRTQNYLIMPLDMSNIFQVGFAKSSFSAGTVIRKAVRGQKSLWGKVFSLGSKEVSNQQNTWFVYQVSPLSGVEAPEGFDHLCRFVYNEYKTLREATLQRDAEARTDADSALRDANPNVDDLGPSLEEEGFEDTM